MLPKCSGTNTWITVCDYIPSLAQSHGLWAASLFSMTYVCVYLCCCRRPSETLCGTSGWGTATRRYDHQYWVIRRRSSSIASSLHLCKHLQNITHSNHTKHQFSVRFQLDFQLATFYQKAKHNGGQRCCELWGKF